MNAQEWAAALAPEVSHAAAYPKVAQVVRSYLETTAGHRVPGSHLSTTQLAEAIFPSSSVRGPIVQAARDRLFRALRALAEHQLADCCQRADPVTRFGKVRYPWHWVKPGTAAPRNVCPHCGGAL